MAAGHPRSPAYFARLWQMPHRRYRPGPMFFATSISLSKFEGLIDDEGGVLTKLAEGCLLVSHLCVSARVNKAKYPPTRGDNWRIGRRRMMRPPIAETRNTLAGIEIFAGLGNDARDRIQRRCSWRSYGLGETILDYMDSGDDVFFLIAGEARVTIYSADGKIVSFRELRAGETFGEYAAIDGAPRSASVEARSNCRVASLPAAVFRDILYAEKQVGQALLKRLVGELRELTTRVFEFSTLAVRYRVQAELLRLASLAPHDDNRARIVPPPTHADIASRVSTHREAVTRELNRLTRLGVVDRRDGALVVEDFDRLARMVHEAAGEGDYD
jgi:CRP/FNR family cyclic AMP-dependent transcriptional regulator